MQDLEDFEAKEFPMRFIVKPVSTQAAARPITLCWKCSEFPAACAGDI